MQDDGRLCKRERGHKLLENTVAERLLVCIKGGGERVYLKAFQTFAG